MRRYDSISKQRSEAGKEVYTSMVWPVIEPLEDDVYITTNSMDRLDALASKYYGNPRYWWLLAMINNLGHGTLAVPGGIQLRIPFNPSAILTKVEEANR